MSRSLRRAAAAAALLACLLLAGCDGRVEVRVGFPTGSEVDELLDAVVDGNRARIRSLLAPTVRYSESRSGWGYTRYRYFSRYEFAERLPHLFGAGDVISASFHGRSARIARNRMTVTGRLYWTVARGWESYTVTGLLTVGLRRYGGGWLISEWHFVGTGVHGRYRYWDEFDFDFDLDIEFDFDFHVDGGRELY